MAGSCVQALYDFPKDANEDLSLNVGDVIKITEVLNDDWLQGVSKHGKGQFPASYVDVIFEKMPESVGTAVADFHSEEDGDLEFEKGEVVGILEDIDDNWCSGCTKKSTGIFPKSFIELLEFNEEDEMVSSGNSETASEAVVEAYGMSNESFTAQSAEEISFPKGVRIDLVQEVDSFWTLGSYKGSKGKFPSMFVTVVNDLPEDMKYHEDIKVEPLQSNEESLPKAKALYMYIGTSEQDLNFDKGEVIYLKERVNADWLKGQIGNTIGMFPASYVQILVDLPFQEKNQKQEKSERKETNRDRMYQNGIPNGHLPTTGSTKPQQRVAPTVVKAKTKKDDSPATTSVPTKAPLKPRLAPKPPPAPAKAMPNTGHFPLQNDCITVIKPAKSAPKRETKAKGKSPPVVRPLSRPTPKQTPKVTSNSSLLESLAMKDHIPNGKLGDISPGIAPAVNTSRKVEQNTAYRPRPVITPPVKETIKKPAPQPTKRQAPALPTAQCKGAPYVTPVVTPTKNSNDLLSSDTPTITKLPKPLAPQPPIKPTTLPIKQMSPIVAKPAEVTPALDQSLPSPKLSVRLVTPEEERGFDTSHPPLQKTLTPPPGRKTRPKSAYNLQPEQSQTMRKSCSLTRRNTARASTRSSSKVFAEMAAAAAKDGSPVGEEEDIGSIELRISDLQSKIAAEANLLSGVETLLEMVTDSAKLNELKEKQNQHLLIIRDFNEDLSDLEDEKSYILAKFGKVEDIMDRLVRVEQQIQMFKSKAEQLEQAVDISTFEDLAEAREDAEFCRCMVETLQDELVTLRERLAEKQKQYLTPEEAQAKQLEQRAKVVEELIRTERDYVRDITLCSTTVINTLKRLSGASIDCDTLFGNMSDVARVSSQLLQSLEEAVIKPLDEIGKALGRCFIDHSTEMKGCYAIYCKNYDDAQVLSEKYEQDPVTREEIMNTMKLIRGEQFTWDLPSYLIKPVQRILKYPLLLQEFLKNTPENEQSREDTALAINSMTDVATSINEFKRRKDLIQKYQKTEGFGDKISRLNWHSVLKKSSRINQRLTQFTGINTRTVDATFNEEEKKVRNLEKLIKTLIKNLATYTEGFQEHANLHKLNICNIYDFCEDLSPPDHVKQYIHASQNLVDAFNKHVNYIQTNVLEPLNKLLQLFQSPFRLMEKREDKLLDYDSLQKKAYRTKDKDKLKQVKDDLAKAKNNYQALNCQLLEDLPKMSAKCSQYVILCLANFIQAHRVHSKEVRSHLGSLPQTAIPTDSAAILSMHSEAIRLASEQLAKLTFTPDKTSSMVDARRSFYGEVPPNSASSLGRTNFYVDFSVFDAEATDDPTSPIKPYSRDERPKELFDFSAPVSPLPPPPRFQRRETPSPVDSPDAVRRRKPSPIADMYRVKYAFNAEDAAEVTVTENEVVRVVTKCDKSGNPDWWYIVAGNSKGYIPSTYLEPVDTNSNEIFPLVNASTPLKTDQCAKDSITSNSNIVKEPEVSAASVNTEAVVSSPVQSAQGLEESATSVVSSENFTPEFANEEEPQVAEFYVAEYDFEKSNIGELDLKEGQLVRVINKHDFQGNIEWWLVEADSVKGYVPGNYLSFVHSVQLG